MYSRVTRIAITLGLGLASSAYSIASEVADLGDEKSNELAENQQPSPVYFQSRFNFYESASREINVFNACPKIDTESKIKVKPDSTESANDLYGQGSSDEWLKLTADSVPENTETRVRLEGNVTMRSSDSLLLADRLLADNVKQTVVAEGNVVVESSDSLLKAKKFQGDQAAETSTLTDVDFHFFSNNGNGKAESISIDSNKVATLSDLTFSTCPSGNQSWRFSANELELDQESGWGEAWGMWLKVKDIPVFYFPYLNFALDDRRKSGILTPSFSKSGRNGMDVGLPVYWNIAPQADATFNFRSIEKRGAQFGAEFRYLSQYTDNNLSFEWLPEDKLARRRIVDEPTASQGVYRLEEERWAVSFKNKTQFTDNWSAEVSAGKVSDRDYFKDLSTEIDGLKDKNLQSKLLSKANISYQDDIWLLSFFAESTQSLIGNEPNRILPSFTTNADYYDVNSGLRLQFESDFTRYDTSNQILTEGSRYNLKPSISYPIRNSYSWLTPKVSYQITEYDIKSADSPVTQSFNREMPSFSLDSGLYFDRATQWNGEDMIHTLKPRLFYTYVPFRDQTGIFNFDSRLPEFSFSQLWKENRFAGHDRIGDTNHFSLALTNQFTSVTATKPILKFSIGKRYYLDDRLVDLDPDLIPDTRDYSPWLAEINVNLSESFEFNGFIEWQEKDRFSEQNSTNLARSQIKFEPKRDHIVNLSHRLRKKGNLSNEELDFSFSWPVNDKWRLVGRWYNDLQNKRTSETLLGFEYESCCWAVSILSRRNIDVRFDAMGAPILTDSLGQMLDEFDSGVSFQFTFKGLGKPGQNKIANRLKNSIRGYRSRF
jgi:LPS-assembly protein